jgi:hypothetical protein
MSYDTTSTCEGKILHYHGVVFQIDKDSGCWLVTSHKTIKAGYVYVNRIFMKGYLYRIAYSEEVRPVLAGERIKHLCRNKITA